MFNVGDRVISEYYGEGTVTQIKTSGESYPIEVKFDRLNTIRTFTPLGYFDLDCKESEMIILVKIKSETKTAEMNIGHNKISQTNTLLQSLSTNNRKFKIKYMDIQQYINKDDLRHIKARVITGTIENFTTNAEVVINGEDGFCIIMYKQILQMEEIREEEIISENEEEKVSCVDCVHHEKAQVECEDNYCSTCICGDCNGCGDTEPRCKEEKPNHNRDID